MSGKLINIPIKIRLFDGNEESIVFLDKYEIERDCYFCTGISFLKATDDKPTYAFEFYDKPRDRASAKNEIIKAFKEAKLGKREY